MFIFQNISLPEGEAGSFGSLGSGVGGMDDRWGVAIKGTDKALEQIRGDAGIRFDLRGNIDSFLDVYILKKWSCSLQYELLTLLIFFR